MKRLFAVWMMLLCLLSGCTSEDALVGKAVKLRNSILGSSECRFHTVVTADYGDSVYSFGMDCQRFANGDITLKITQPETISGITAGIDGGTGRFVFDDQTLVFELVADEQMSPIGAPWVFLQALCSGYISACGAEEEGIRIQIDDSFKNAQYSVEVWTGSDELPIRAEVIWQGKRILSLDIDDFVIV